MRVFFVFLLLLILSSILTLTILSSITGNVVNTPNCSSGHTYAFYRTLAEKQAVEQAWMQAGFVPVSFEPAPASFESSGETGFMCMRRMTYQELKQASMRERGRVITVGSSV